MDQHVFAIAPLELARDHRVTAAQYRILLALLSFRNKRGDLVWPSRERIAELTGYTVNSVSKYTQQLERIGWLQKEGRGGRSQSVRYTITVPADETLSNLETVSKVETLSNPATKTLSNPATKTLSNLDRGIEQTSEQTSEQTTYTSDSGNPTRVVFDYWRERMGKPGAKLDNKRRGAINRRLDDGYTVDQLKAAVDGCAASRWHQGRNDRKRAYNDIELICRDAVRADQFIDLASRQQQQDDELDSFLQDNSHDYIDGEFSYG